MAACGRQDPDDRTSKFMKKLPFGYVSPEAALHLAGPSTTARVYTTPGQYPMRPGSGAGMNAFVFEPVNANIFRLSG